MTDKQSTQPKYTLAPSRVGKKQISAYFKKETFKQLSFLAIEKETSMQGLIREALNDLFKKYGKPQVAD